MKTTLIKLQDKFILVSDEEIKDDDLCLDINSNQIFKCWKNKPNDGIYEWKNNQSWVRLHKNCKKVIAGFPELPSIDFSLLSEADCKTIGYVDVEKLAIKEHKFNHKSVNEISFRLGFIEGFKTAQSLNDKRFSLEDIIQAINLSREKLPYNFDGKDCAYQFLDEEIIQSLQQTSWDVEVEMEEHCKPMPNIHVKWREPKITKNSIKITKIL